MFRAATITEFTKLTTFAKCGQFCDFSKPNCWVVYWKAQSPLKVAELNSHLVSFRDTNDCKHTHHHKRLTARVDDAVEDN